MRVEGGVGEALPVVLAEELAVAQADVVDLVAGATAVRPLPLLGRHLALPENSHTRTVSGAMGIVVRSQRVGFPQETKQKLNFLPKQ